MLPGQTTKLTEELVASAASVTVRADLVRMSGNTTLVTINPQFGGGFSGIIFIVPTTAAIQTTTTGNILNAVTMPQNQVTVLVFSKALGKFVAGAIS